MFIVHGMASSGNCYKVKLVLEQLHRPYKWVEVDSTAGGTRTADFLAMNPNGKVPTMQLDDGSFLPESNAILWYLAEDTPLMSSDRLGRARTLQWMFFEQYSHEPYVAVARYILRYLPADAPQRSNLPRLHERGDQALGVMEQHLAREPFFVDGRYSIADIALFAYTHCADEGGFSLEPYPAIRAWLDRVRSQPRFVALG